MNSIGQVIAYSSGIRFRGWWELVIFRTLNYPEYLSLAAVLFLKNLKGFNRVLYN